MTVRNLELVEPLFRDGASESTLFHALDCCQTPMGKRLLRATILRPLLSTEGMACRYAAVAELTRALIEREELRRALGCVLDLERLLARISLDRRRAKGFACAGGVAAGAAAGVCRADAAGCAAVALARGAGGRA